MSFNVTQCPACESTFNTNSRVLAAAAGKVRCGACLNVFEAIDHFLISEEDDAELAPGESVFVGNNPQEYFDPSRFLTRSALREPEHDETDAADPASAKILHEKLEQSETVNEEFFITVAEELLGREEPIISDTPLTLEDENVVEEPLQELPQQQPAEETDEVLEVGFEEDILNSFSEQEVTDFDADVEAEELEAHPSDHEPSQETTLSAQEPQQAESNTGFEEDILNSFSEQQVTDFDADVETEELEAHPSDHEPSQETTLSAQEPQQAESNTGFEEDILNSFSEQEVTDFDADEEAEEIQTQPSDHEPRQETTLPAQELKQAESSTETVNSRQQPEEAPVGLELSASFSFGYFSNLESTEEEPETGEPEQADQPEEGPVKGAPQENSELENDSALGLAEQSEEQFLSTITEELQGSQLLRPEESPATDVAASEQASFAEDTEIEATIEAEESEHAAAQALDSAVDLDLEYETDLDPHEPLDTATDWSGFKIGDIENDMPAAASVVSPDEEGSTTDTQLAEEESRDDSTEAIRARALETQLDDEEALEAIPQENLAALGAMSSPVEFITGKESRLLRSTLLFLSIVLLGVMLSGQVLWQRMELYSQLPQLRGFYEYACSITGCELPEFSAISSIRSENLTVQTHPTFENGLMVNTVIRNTAAFEQPFPILILSFNSAANSIIALREFTASEYLDSGLRSVQSMPPNTPVQIGMAIMDPGPLAVNYTLAFRLP